MRRIDYDDDNDVCDYIAIAAVVKCL